MNEDFAKKKRFLGLFFGVSAGAAFALTAWGIDALKLSNANLADPALKFVPGLLICLIAGGFVGWLTIALDKPLISLLLWGGFGALLVWLILWLPVQAAPKIITFLHPNLNSWLEYPLVEGTSQLQIIGLIVIAIPCLLAGLLEPHLVEQALASGRPGSLIGLVLACAILLGGVGFAGDDLLNKHFREPVQVMDDLLAFAQDNYGKEVEQTLARRMHLSTVDGLGDLVLNPRELTIAAYDRNLGQVDIFVNFSGKWVRCTTIYSQPVRCELVKNLSLRYSLPTLNGILTFYDKNNY